MNQITTTTSFSSSSAAVNIDCYVDGSQEFLEGLLLQRQQEERRQRQCLLRLQDLKLQQQEEVYRSHVLSSMMPMPLPPLLSSSATTTTYYGWNYGRSSPYNKIASNERNVLDLLEDTYIDPIVERHMSLSPERIAIT